MKKSILSLAAAALIFASAFSFAGCGSNGSSDNSKAVSDTSAASSKQESSESDQTSAAIAENDTVFTYDGKSIELNSNVEDMIANFGEANNVDAQLTCHGTEGEDKTYTYDDFTVNSYPLDGKDFVMEILISKAGVPTAKGIEVGSSSEEVVAAYGSEYKEIGVYYAYDAPGKKSLRFYIEDGTVKEIDYYYTV